MIQLITSFTARLNEELAPLLMEPIGFAALAAGVFVLLGLVTWSFRDVANRHSQKTGKSGDGYGGSH
jgi:hypothetical protein